MHQGFSVSYLCVRVLWVDAPQPIRSILGGDGEARGGWEDLLPSIRNTNLLQVFLAVLPGHAGSPTREAPPCLCVCDRKGDRNEKKAESFSFPLHFQGDYTSPQSFQIMSSDLCIKIRSKRACISIMSPIGHINQTHHMKNI